MDNKKMFYFLSGLPRSGSTLLSSILNQNPNIYASSNSPVCGTMFSVESNIVNSEQYSAFPKPDIVPSMVYGILEGYYSDTAKNIIIDKSRGWCEKASLELLLRNLPYEPKIILTVRDIKSILASFIHLIHNNSDKVSFIDNEINQLQQFNFYRPDDDIRCDYLMQPKGLIDNSLYGIATALNPDNRKYFHFVEYDDLVDKTEETVLRIYKFLEIDPFEHNFNNIINHTPENDDVYGIDGLHSVRKEISRRGTNPEEILSSYVLNKYSELELWR
jgi:sulfotransferase